MAKDNAYYLDEGLYISAKAPTGAEIRKFGNGGGGPGSGGWGLSEGVPRGTSPTKPDIAQTLSTERVLTEEYQALEKQYEDEYSAQTAELPQTISNLKTEISKAAENGGNTAKQTALTSRISQIRADYLQIVPDANSYYGAPAFYKRGDSMMSRFLDPGVFTVRGEALGREYISRLQRSWEGAHRLHLEAQKHQALADELHTLAIQVDQEEISQQPLDLPRAIARRTEQINAERQIHFDCLPSFVQHELSAQTAIDASYTLVQTFNAYLATAAALVQTKQSQIPPFDDQNPQIKSPLSKPQLEGLLHLVEDQRLRRAGQRWKEYHQALALTESIRFLGVFASATQNLMQRAVEVEQLRGRHDQEQAVAQETAHQQAQEAARQQAQAAAQEAARQQKEAERKAKEQSYIYRLKPGELQALERPATERRAKEAKRKAEADRRAKEAADKAEAQRQRWEQDRIAKAEAQAASAARLAQKRQAELDAKQAILNASAARREQKAARKAAAERQAEEAQQALEAQRKQQENERIRNTFTAIGSSAASLPLVIPIGPSSFGNPTAAYAALQAAIRSAVTSVLSSGAGALVATVGLAWPSNLGNSDRQYLISTPLKDLSPPGGPDLEALALSSGSVDLPYLLAGSEDENDLGLYVVSGGQPVAVRAAKFDTARQVYSLALDNPQRILTWTPASAPGAEEGSSTSLLPAPPGTVIYTGSSLNPVRNESESYPALDLLDQERLIVTFPMDSGLPPILVVFKSPRYEPGTSNGNGAQVTDTWREQAASPEGAPIPAQIADVLRGIEFKTFTAFRRRFWKAVANDPELSKQFSPQDLRRMKKHGYAPWADKSDQYKSKRSYEIHHVVPISEKGGVYDMDNLVIFTPKIHNLIHYGGKK